MATGDRGFRDLIAFIESEVEFASSYYNDAYLDRRISARMRRTDVDSYRRYKRLLERDEGEREALLDSLSINVTGFFRNPEVWEALRPVLADVTDGGRASVWSAPCSDGREPYSVAMLALDADDVPARRLSVTGSDIDEAALAAARRGVYEATPTTDISEELAPLDDRDAYVERDADCFRMRDAVTDMVSFDRHDLIQGGKRGPFDLVLCRNLFIYIDPQYKEPIFETLDASLREGGYLVIGKTETVPAQFEDAYEVVDRDRRIYRRP
ncbi:MAG: protein-glutamate O-methyltransferase CheR [Halobacteriaceae archaeon]